ncbi:MAG TPA: hypothetical protein VD866_30565 [Urbifossiella sp.]|nr:hypothetical protein [Urbifossiella sp.]
MTTTAPARSALSPGFGRLALDRQDITFTTPRPGVLSVAVTVRNVGRAPTLPTPALLRSAPLGAFVPWTPLDTLVVPPLLPGRSTVLRGEYALPTPLALGGADRIPTNRALVALGLGEPDRPRRPAAPAADVMGVFGLGSLHWAGNINLFFPKVDVERHTAMALRVYPGRTNLAMFVVGTGPADRYKLELSGTGTAWNPRLFDTLPQFAPAEAARHDPLTDDRWHRLSSGMLVLTVDVPAAAREGAVNVHVRQESSGREAVVEFTLDAAAAGPGCYQL